MSYTFKNTERNNLKATVFETKSLLYLIGKRLDRTEIDYVAFDCFNDVSGVNKSHKDIWDIQSKNEAKLSPKKIGKYLFTLFDNYLSIFSFKEFIFFCPPLDINYLVDNSLSSYKINNIVETTRTRIRTGLVEEVNRVKGVSIDYTKEIDIFLTHVLFVEDHEDEKDYIKSIVKFKNKEIKSDDFYTSIFKELRDKQSTKKNSHIEDKSIKEIREVLSFNRHLSVKDIELLIASRIIGMELFVNSLYYPFYFSPYVESLSMDEKKDILQECNSNLSRAFFNKNNSKSFWKLCEDIVVFISNNHVDEVDPIYRALYSKTLPRVFYLNELTIKYLISIILEGFKNDN